MKTLVKLLAVVLILSIALSACAPAAPQAEPQEEVATQAPVEKQLTIGFAAMNSGWPWFATFIKTYEERAKKDGWETITLSANGDVATQINQIQDLISKKVDYLIIGPLDSKAVIPSLKAAKEANIPVIIIGNDLDQEGAQYVTAIRIPDDRELGKNSAELMVEALKDKPGKKIFVIEGLPGQPAVTLRWEAMKPVFEQGGIEVVASQPADWDINKAIKVTEELVTAYPDIDGVFSMDGSMTPGIVQVMEESKIDVPIVGLGGTKTEVDLLKDGKIFGTACQSPGANANAAMDVIETLVAGKTVELRGTVPTPKITSANIDQCPGDW